MSSRKPTSYVVQEGDVLAGRYRPVRFVASGGMGEVWEAEDEKLHERIALKTVRPDAVDPQSLERLLRETRVPVGLLSNGHLLRLVYAPRGESAGHVTFPVAALTEVAGRPLLSALVMLLHADRLFAVPEGQRLPAILANSRR